MAAELEVLRMQPEQRQVIEQVKAQVAAHMVQTVPDIGKYDQAMLHYATQVEGYTPQEIEAIRVDPRQIKTLLMATKQWLAESYPSPQQAVSQQAAPQRGFAPNPPKSIASARGSGARSPTTQEQYDSLMAMTDYEFSKYKRDNEQEYYRLMERIESGEK
jgi:hypothetical protein